ncbi:hypothetical protein F4820DRAFT_88680 [Hypoxylon rubiginosum]|uniref:Uncharacterized protein n=1 Tax=Hypoxylon rubiginosum TaxID=110542 RepID=A0ACB9ZBN1_9PEZI|nr:hypothetical protein F4820DRAFT_88680 [Hypoxylon rubiginosum]
MSTTTSLSAPAASTTSQCGATLYNIPVDDAACAMPSGGNHTDVLSACCGDADVVSYYDGCGLYCLAAGQTVDDLTTCLFTHGAGWSDVFCNKNGTSTATATDAALPTSAGASVVASHGATHTSGESGGSSSETSGATDSPAAAAGLRPEFGSVSTLGLTIGALLFSATAFGAFQL